MLEFERNMNVESENRIPLCAGLPWGVYVDAHRAAAGALRLTGADTADGRRTAL